MISSFSTLTVALLASWMAVTVSAQRSTCLCNTFIPCKAEFLLAQSACLTVSQCLSSLTDVPQQNRQLVAQCYVVHSDYKNRMDQCMESIAGQSCSNTAAATTNNFFRSTGGRFPNVRHRGGGGGFGRDSTGASSSTTVRNFLTCVNDCLQNPPSLLLDQASSFNGFVRRGGGGGLMCGNKFCENKLNCRTQRPTDYTLKQQAKTQCEQQLGSKDQQNIQLCQCLSAAGVPNLTCTLNTNTNQNNNNGFGNNGFGIRDNGFPQFPGTSGFGFNGQQWSDDWDDSDCVLECGRGVKFRRTTYSGDVNNLEGKQ